MNGKVKLKERTYRSKADYTCNDGFDRVGDRYRTCQADRSWSGIAPFCECKLCEVLNNICSYSQNVCKYKVNFSCMIHMSWLATFRVFYYANTLFFQFQMNVAKMRVHSAFTRKSVAFK